MWLFRPMTSNNPYLAFAISFWSLKAKISPWQDNNSIDCNRALSNQICIWAQTSYSVLTSFLAGSGENFKSPLTAWQHEAPWVTSWNFVDFNRGSPPKSFCCFGIWALSSCLLFNSRITCSCRGSVSVAAVTALVNMVGESKWLICLFWWLQSMHLDRKIQRIIVWLCILWH